MSVEMKYVLLLVAVLSLNGCNTLIGLGRDTRDGFFWCNDKIHDWHHQQEPNQDVAPVY
jgi:hypothetical protein